MKNITIRFAVAFSAVLLMGACADGGGGSGSATKADSPLRIAFGTDVTTLNPWMTKSVATDMSVISQIYQTLTVRQSDLAIKPLLAESWEHSAPDTWTFKLRQGVTFADGEPFNAAAVKWNIEKVQDPATKARIAPNMAIVKSVTAVGDSTITIQTKTPDTTIPALMSYFFFVAPKWADGHDLASQPMGTGPYELKTWNHNSLIELKKRANYWGQAVSYSDVQYKILPDPASQIAALQTGDVDLITLVGPDQMDRVKAIQDVTAGSIPTIRSAFLMLNTRNKPLDNPQVRQALNYAVDKDTIVKNLFHGLTAPSPGEPLTKEYVGFNADASAYPYDPAKAKQLLAEAGYAKGFSITLSYPSSTYLLADKVTQVVKEQLGTVGVTVNVTPEPFASWLSNMYAGKIADGVYLTYAWPTLDGSDLLRNFAPDGAQTFWTNQDFATALVAAQGTGDEAQHAQNIQSAVAIMRDDAPFVFLFAQPLTYAHSSSVNWTPRPDDWVRADDMTRR